METRGILRFLSCSCLSDFKQQLYVGSGHILPSFVPKTHGALSQITLKRRHRSRLATVSLQERVNVNVSSITQDSPPPLLTEHARVCGCVCSTPGNVLSVIRALASLCMGVSDRVHPTWWQPPSVPKWARRWCRLQRTYCIHRYMPQLKRFPWNQLCRRVTGRILWQPSRKSCKVYFYFIFSRTARSPAFV